MADDPEILRSRSVDVLTSLGFTAPPRHLPLLDVTVQRSRKEVAERIGCLSAVAAVAYGMPEGPATAWLEQEGLMAGLSDNERDFLELDDRQPGHAAELKPQSIYALAWALGLVEGADDLRQAPPDELVTKVPTPPPATLHVADIVNGSVVRAEDIPQVLDTTYCVLWVLVDSRLRGQRLEAVDEWVVLERRRAWEWLVSDEDWTTGRSTHRGRRSRAAEPHMSRHIGTDT